MCTRLMDIAAMSIVLNQGQIQQQAGISVMKMAMDVARTKGNSVLGEKPPIRSPLHKGS